MTSHEFLELAVVQKGVILSGRGVQNGPVDLVLGQQVSVLLLALLQSLIGFKLVTLVPHQIQLGRADLVHHLNCPDRILESDRSSDQHNVNRVESLEAFG